MNKKVPRKSHMRKTSSGKVVPVREHMMKKPNNSKMNKKNSKITKEGYLVTSPRHKDGKFFRTLEDAEKEKSRIIRESNVTQAGISEVNIDWDMMIPSNWNRIKKYKNDAYVYHKKGSSLFDEDVNVGKGEFVEVRTPKSAFTHTLDYVVLHMKDNDIIHRKEFKNPINAQNFAINLMEKNN